MIDAFFGLETVRENKVGIATSKAHVSGIYDLQNNVQIRIYKCCESFCAF